MQEFLDSETERSWVIEVILFTRNWIHYGTMGFVFAVILTAAAEGLLGR